MSTSVTQALRLYNNFEAVDPSLLAEAAERGKIAHRCCAAIVSGLPYFCELEHQPYVDSFQKYFDARVVKVYFCEERMKHSVFGYTGQPDLVADLDFDGIVATAVVDYKTSQTKNRTWMAQLAAYKELVLDKYDMLNIDVIISLRLMKDGSMARADRQDVTDRHFAAFQNALFAYRYFIAKE